jgi:hypothetical protein
MSKGRRIKSWDTNSEGGTAAFADATGYDVDNKRMTGDRLCHVIHQQVTSPCQMYRYVFTILRRILNIQMREDL